MHIISYRYTVNNYATHCSDTGEYLSHKLFDKSKTAEKIMKRLKSFETKANEGLSRNPV